MRLETQRLILREWRLFDADDLFEYASMEDVGPSAGWKPHQSREESVAIIQLFMKEEDVFAIQLKDNGKVIGSVGLHKAENPEGVRSLGYVLSKTYWGLGLMTEAVNTVIKYAFEQLGLQSINVAHFEGNFRSERVIEKAGFEFSEYKHNAARIKYDNSIKSLYCYVLSRERYMSNNCKAF